MESIGRQRIAVLRLFYSTTLKVIGTAITKDKNEGAISHRGRYRENDE
jgi:hypothetical protein